MSVIVKIKALLAKASSTNNANEAAAFAQKANELMEKYQIDVDAIRASDDPVGKDFSYEGKTAGYRQALSCAAARYYGCRAIIKNPDRAGVIRVEIFGRESARVTALAMYPYFLKTCHTLGRTMAAEIGGCWKGHSRAIAMELALRLRTLAPKMETSDGVVTGKNALIRLDEINMLVEETYPNLRRGRRTKFTSSALARQYANSVGLSSQVGRSSALAIGAQ